MISFSEKARRLGNVGAIGAPLLCGFFVGSYGRLANSVFRLKQVDVSDLYCLSRLFLGQGTVAAVVAFWSHRSSETLGMEARCYINSGRAVNEFSAHDL